MSVRVEPHPEIEHPPHTAAGRGEKKKLWTLSVINTFVNLAIVTQIGENLEIMGA